MTIKAGEVGKAFLYATYYALGAASDLELKITGPAGVVIIPNARISTPNVEAIDPDLGVLPAGTYMAFNTEETDFPVEGVYHVCGKYVDGSPKVYYGDTAIFTVEASCYA